MLFCGDEKMLIYHQRLKKGITVYNERVEIRKLGDQKQYTFDGQSSYVFENNGTFYLMLDHWQPDNLQNSGYSILPIKFDKYGNMIIEWADDWQGI